MSDKDRQNSTAALSLLMSASNNALSTIDTANGNVDDDLKDLDQVELAIIRKDFISLLSLIYASTTKVALVLKPKSPTYSASLTPLKDLVTQVGKLSQNVRLVREEHGLTLLKEFKSVSKSVISSVNQFATVLLDQAEGKQSSDDLYLTKTGEVHQTIEKARDSAGGLSSWNHVAVRKVWELEQGSLSDAMNELKELSEGDSNNDDDDGEDDFGDGWDELGLEAPSKMSTEDLERLKKMEPIVKLSTLLHRYVIKRILSAHFETLPIQAHINPILDQLTGDSAALSAAVDDLASTAYAPQDVEEMAEQLDQFKVVSETLSSRIESLLTLPSVDDLLKGSGKETPAKKWFDTCFGQIATSVEQLSKLLAKS